MNKKTRRSFKKWVSKRKGENHKRREIRTKNKSEEIDYIPHNAIGEDTLEDIMNKLVSIADVHGAAIIRTDGSIISWQSKDNGDNGNPKQYIDSVMDYIASVLERNIDHHIDGMFMESIVDFNGSKLLTHRIRKNIMLLLVLDKKAYIGLTMLDVEGCLQDINSALGSSNWDYETPG
jgi:predicted regulator of Ras-like GTPase activity (Roadblock/LC7/MglB family)